MMKIISAVGVGAPQGASAPPSKNCAERSRYSSRAVTVIMRQCIIG